MDLEVFGFAHSCQLCYVMLDIASACTTSLCRFAYYLRRGDYVFIAVYARLFVKYLKISYERILMNFFSGWGEGVAQAQVE